MTEFMDKVRNASMPPGSSCCGKPQGCTMTHKGCRYLRHPAKRANVFNEIVCWHCGSPVTMRGTLCADCMATWQCECGQTNSLALNPTCINCAQALA